jgi:hypothetical protein
VRREREREREGRERESKRVREKEHTHTRTLETTHERWTGLPVASLGMVIAVAIPCLIPCDGWDHVPE